MSKHWLKIGIIALALVSVSCGLIGQFTERLQGEYEKGKEVVATVEEMASESSSSEEEKSTGAESTGEGDSKEETMAEDTPSTSSAEEASLPDLEEDALSQLETYRMRFSWTLEKADGSTESLTMEQAATRDPQAQQFLMGSGEESIEYIQIEDQVWIRYGEEWMQSSSDTTGDLADEFGSGLMDESDWIDEVEDEDYEYLGKEDVNGIQARHYRAEYDESWPTLLGEEGADDIDQGIADVWIADENDLPAFVVRFEVEIKGTADSENITGKLSQEIYDVNADFTIAPPEDAESGGLPDDLPLYPEAEGLTTFGSMTMFTVGDDIETVNEFYLDALESAGWSQVEGSAMSTDEMATTTWTKDGETLTLNVVKSEDEDGTQVIFTLGE
jgi:hypothetical protein